ncbi:MAG: glycosyltransferase [Fibrobacteria bacterium]
MSSAISSRKPRYSVVIVTYNSLENIRVCLESLRRCGPSLAGTGAPGHEIIVVDNNSRDGTQEYLRTQGDIRAILNDGNNGFSKGCNQGAAIAKGDFVIFLNPDTLATPGWLDTMVRYFQDPTVGAVGPVSNYVAGLQRLDMNLPPAWRDAKTFPGNGAVEVADNLARILKEGNAGRGVTTKLLIGFCLMMERSRYEAMGGMDENLFLGNDDLDLSWRLRNLGLKLVVASDAFIFHEGQKSFKTEAKSHVDRLTQESTDALYVKLVEHYGGRENLPSAIDLWGIGWFSPSPSLLSGPLNSTRDSRGVRGSELRSDEPHFFPSDSRGVRGSELRSDEPQKGGTMDSGRSLKIKQETPSALNAGTGGIREQNTWKSLSVIIYVGANADIAGGGPESVPSDSAARLERTLATLPAKPGVDILVINCGDPAALAGSQETPAGTTLRRLDLGARFPIRQALDIALALASGSHALCCMAGVEFSSMFNHWLDKRDLSALGAALPLPLRIGEGDKAACAAYAFLARKDWFKSAMGAPAVTAAIDVGRFLAAMSEQLRFQAQASATEKSVDAPWLMARAADMPAGETWTPVKAAGAAGAGAAGAGTAGAERTGAEQAVLAATPARENAEKRNLLSALNQMGHKERAQSMPSDVAATAQTLAGISGAMPVGSQKAADPISLYPETLRAAMREAKNIGFAGVSAELPPVTGAFRVFDVMGALVPVASQDLIILRVTPDMVEGLTSRMANIRRLAPGLKRMIAVYDGAKAMGVAPTSPLAPVDLTPDGIRSALWGAGFAVRGQSPYSGFPQGSSGADPVRGWIQTDAAPRSPAHLTEKMVSIVILGFNQVEYTKKCIESIRKHTRQKYELILIDNGSKDGTEAFFRSIAGAKVIRNPENLGVSKGWNQGMRVASGEYILILNNDIIVGPDWLENMVRLAESDPSIGLVGPRSNYIAGPQIVANVPYKTEAEIQPFIRAWQEEHSLAASEFGFIKGFCHLMPRRVFAKVGFYDERFGKGNFEDDDYCLRVRYHGFRALFADDVFIHHYGSVSFNQESVDWRALMIENQKKYEAKWAKGQAAIHDTQVDEPVLTDRNPDRAAQTEPPQVEAGRAAYAKGEIDRARALFLEAQKADPAHPEALCCLGVLSFSSGNLQEAVAFFMGCLNLDPAHEDAAQNLIEALSARNGGVSLVETAALVKRYPSNAILAAAKVEAAAVEAEDAAALQQAAQTAQAALSARIEPLASAEFTVTAAENPAWTPVPDAKRLPAWRDEVEALIESAKYGQAMDILEGRVRGQQDQAACSNYLGIIAHACGDTEMALTHFTAAHAKAPAEVDILFNLSDTLLAVGRPAEAVRLLEEAAPKSGVESDPTLIDLAATAEQIRHAMSKGRIDTENLLASRDANQEAERLLRMGALAEAKTYLDLALECDAGDFRAHNNMGLLAWYREDGEAAWRCFNHALAIRPAWSDALVNAFDTALALGDVARIAPCVEAALSASPSHAAALSIRKHLQAQGPVIREFKNFEQLEANAALLVKAEKAMDQAKQAEAILVYLEAIKLQPQNPQAYNGLGILAFSDKRLADAYGLFEAASGLHPADQDILMNLWQSARAMSRESEVLPKLRQSLQRNPALEDVKAIIKEFA